MERLYVDRESAIRAALAAIKRELLTRRTICVQMYASLQTISLYEIRRGRKDVVARFRWGK